MNDIERRRLMNAQMRMGNKRGIPPTEYKVEATQTINPLTKRAYLDKDYLRVELHSDPLRKFDKENYFLEIILEDFSNSLFSKEKAIPKPTSTNFTEYQLALARMDVRDKKMSSSDYRLARGRIQNLISQMNESNVPLGLISSPQGLDSALNEIEQNEWAKGQFKDILSFNENSVSYIPKFDRDILDKYNLGELNLQKLN